VSSGTPVGVHVAEPVEITSGCPFDVTRVVPTVHCAVTHGPPEFGGSGQPATTHGVAIVAVGWFATSTRVFGVAGVARPP